MKKRHKALLLLAPLAALLLTTATLHVCGIYINTSRSLSPGVYRLLPEEEISRGDYVIVSRLDELNVDRRLCRAKRLLKIAAAFSGDVIDCDGKYIYVNGRKLSGSKIQPVAAGVQEPLIIDYPYIVPKDHVYLSSNHEYGYDSRYFGTVPTSNVLGKAVPVMLFQ